MYIHIRNDDDIDNFMDNCITNNNLLNLIYLHRLMCPRSVISIGKYMGEYYLEMYIVNSKSIGSRTFQLKWNISINEFTDQAGKLGFRKDSKNNKTLYSELSWNQTEKQENLLFETLINIALGNNQRYIKRKYGLK